MKTAIFGSVRARAIRSQGLVLVLCLLNLGTPSLARCRQARPDETPHGANELVVHDEQTVSRLRGTVFIGDGGPSKGVVIEIYRYEGTAYETTKFLKNAHRIAACLTGEDGVFAFEGLRPGLYLLRAGTVVSMGINEVQAIFRVTGNGKTRNIKIQLSLGT